MIKQKVTMSALARFALLFFGGVVLTLLGFIASGGFDESNAPPIFSLLFVIGLIAAVVGFIGCVVDLIIETFKNVQKLK